MLKQVSWHLNFVNFIIVKNRDEIVHRITAYSERSR